MNKLSTARRTAILVALLKGNSIRATCRMVGVAKNTVLKLLVDVGRACAAYQHKDLRNLRCQHLQCDEIWTFVYAKARNVPPDKVFERGVGDAWTWAAIDAETKLVPSWLIGGRDARTARMFMYDLATRLAHRVQLTTDGHHAYLHAVRDAFHNQIDYAMLVKLYGGEGSMNRAETRYSPAICNGSERITIRGEPDPDHVSMSCAERQNLTMRMSMQRFTRLINGFSKKFENLGHAIALHFQYYNYCRRHRTINITPCQAAGVTDRQWSIEDILALID